MGAPKAPTSFFGAICTNSKLVLRRFQEISVVMEWNNNAASDADDSMKELDFFSGHPEHRHEHRRA